MNKVGQDAYGDAPGEQASIASPVEALYRAHAPELLNYARRYADSREDAEDIMLAVFIAALESNIMLERSRQEQAAWLWRVLKNKTADYQRRTLRARQYAATTPEAAGETISADDEWLPDEAVLRREAYRELREAVNRLPTSQQEILHLRFALGLRCKEIALRLNKGEGAVRMLLSRSLNALRRSYEQQAEGDVQHESE